MPVVCGQFDVDQDQTSSTKKVELVVNGKFVYDVTIVYFVYSLFTSLHF